jgi:hypothetical protein
VEDENEALFCDPQAVVRREMMISNHELQQFTNEIRREEIAAGRQILSIAGDHRSKEFLGEKTANPATYI